jgi:hypothetical protein
MEIMKELWEEKEYASLGYTAQNLRDKAAQVLKTTERTFSNSCTNDVNETSVNYFENEECDLARNLNNQRCEIHSTEVRTEAKNVNEVNANTTDEVNNIHDPPPTSTCATFQWGELNREACIVAINEAYEEIVCWKRNIFLLPSGKVGKAFIKELARLYQAYADESPLECIALKACPVMQSVLLQKPHAKSKSKEHVVCL